MKTLKLAPLFVLATVLLLSPQQQPAKADAPKPEKTADGMRYKFPSAFGTGAVTLSRESGYLRVDVETILPYDAGDAAKYSGSSTEVILSVDGVNGRRMLAFPARIWEPHPVLPEFRYEVSFEADKATLLSEASSFASSGNVKFWDRFQTTFWINLAKVIVTGNSADKVSDDWKIGFVSGNYLGSAALPDTLNVDKPGTNASGFIGIKVSNLPERAKPRVDPFLAALQREKALQMDLSKAASFCQQRKYKQAYDAFKELVKVYPEQLAPRYICWSLADRLPQMIKDDSIALLKDYVESCPSQLANVNLYLTKLMSNNRDQDAFAFYQTAATSPLASIPARKAELEINWAGLLIDNGYVAKAEPMLAVLLENDSIKTNDFLRIPAKLLAARVLEAKGDSKNAGATYAKLLTDEKKALTAVDASGKEVDDIRAVYYKEMRSLHEFAVSQWDAELALQEAEKKTKQPRITFETTKGKFVVELYQDDAPNTVASIVSLVKKKFYDGLTFHNYSPAFLIQGGDPKGDGSGLPGYRLKTEGQPDNRRNFFRGTMAMSNFAPNTDTEGSQFIITTQNTKNTFGLNGKLVVVGRVIEGMEVVDMLRKSDKIKTATVSNLRDGSKYEPVTLPQ